MIEQRIAVGLVAASGEYGIFFCRGILPVQVFSVALVALAGTWFK
jgi:hypothetical protein